MNCFSGLMRTLLDMLGTPTGIQRVGSVNLQVRGAMQYDETELLKLKSGGAASVVAPTHRRESKKNNIEE